jgi:GMP synthase (glutamine-hydrolysing)
MNKIVEKHQVPFTYHWVSTHGTSSLDFSQDVSGYIIFGSDSNVVDRLPWQIALAEFMKSKIEAGIPTLGICFGHQLMADAYGAKVDLVTEDNKCYEGIRSHKVVKSAYGFDKGEELTTFITHHWEVKELPQGFMHLSSSDICFYDGLAHEKYPYISFQGHPEASRHFVQNHLEEPITEESINKGLTGGDYIISKFIELVKNS